MGTEAQRRLWMSGILNSGSAACRNTILLVAWRVARVCIRSPEPSRPKDEVVLLRRSSMGQR